MRVSETRALPLGYTPRQEKYTRLYPQGKDYFFLLSNGEKGNANHILTAFGIWRIFFSLYLRV